MASATVLNLEHLCDYLVFSKEGLHSNIVDSYETSRVLVQETVDFRFNANGHLLPGGCRRVEGWDEN